MLGVVKSEGIFVSDVAAILGFSHTSKNDVLISKIKTNINKEPSLKEAYKEYLKPFIAQHYEKNYPHIVLKQEDLFVHRTFNYFQIKIDHRISDDGVLMCRTLPVNWNQYNMNVLLCEAAYTRAILDCPYVDIGILIGTADAFRVRRYLCDPLYEEIILDNLHLFWDEYLKKRS
jgi:hypothetical protein